MQERRFDTGAVMLNYAEGPPNGPPLVLLHGGSASWRYGVALIELLRDQWYVYAPDLRGHGKSGHVPGNYTLPDYATDIAALLQDVVREPAILVGHSLGGNVALIIAAEYPGLVKAVITGDALLTSLNQPVEIDSHNEMNVLWISLTGKPIGAIEVALREMPVAVAGQAELVPAEEAYGENSPWFAFQALNLHRLDSGTLAMVLEGPEALLGGNDPEALLRTISCPVLILQSDPDEGSVIQAEGIARALALLDAGTHVQLEGIGHELHGLPDQARQVLNAISPFLDSLDQPG